MGEEAAIPKFDRGGEGTDHDDAAEEKVQADGENDEADLAGKGVLADEGVTHDGLARLAHPSGRRPLQAFHPGAPHKPKHPPPQ